MYLARPKCSFSQAGSFNRVYTFGGMERWNGTVEWTTGMEYSALKNISVRAMVYPSYRTCHS